jgi:lipoic acid synthetase
METLRRPPWLTKKIAFDDHQATSRLLADIGLNTVCREAKCPNISECYHRRHATFLLLGRSCTRGCRFCHVGRSAPQPPDPAEPRKVAEAARRLDLAHVVITSVTRDDLPDGGASHFAAAVAAVRRQLPAAAIELLIPDFQKALSSLETVAHSGPDIIGHNIETVPRLYSLRAGADYRRSLAVLSGLKKLAPRILTKSALLLGLGETNEEIREVLGELQGTGCDLLALGQYLRPSMENTAVARYIPPEEFEGLRSAALQMGFKHVEAGPYVRSSYRASEYLK